MMVWDRADTDPPGPAARLVAAGFTLIEMLIALALFALISLAGFGLIEAVLGVQQRTQGRLERLADIQRAMFLVSRDFEQLADGPLVVSAAGVAFVRHGATGSDVAVRYGLDDGALERTVGAVGQSSHAQRLVDRVAGLRWQLFLAPFGWNATWPPPGVAPSVRPQALSLDIVLRPADGLPGGTVRRLVALPAQP